MPTIWTRALAALLLAFAATGASPALARNCTPAERAAADRELHLTDAERQAAIAAHMPWGLPRDLGPTSNERLLVQRDYLIGYDGDLRAPLWTAERIDHARLTNIPRVDCFRADPRLPAAEASTPADYREPIYDQGHMAAFANQTASVNAGLNSFIMSNMAPQTCGLNRGIWQILEGIVRLWAAEHGTVWVVSGSVFDRDRDGVRDPDGAAELMLANNRSRRVAVPSAFYKVISYQRPDGALRTLSIMLPHDDANPDGPEALAYLQRHVTSVAQIEQVAGIDLHPEAGDLGESAELWSFRGRQPRSLCRQSGQSRRAGERG
jgi:endonuclease G, mitochondrial